MEKDSKESKSYRFITIGQIGYTLLVKKKTINLGYQNYVQVINNIAGPLL